MKKAFFRPFCCANLKKKVFILNPALLEKQNSVNEGQGNIIFDIDEREGLIVNNENFYASKQIIIIVILQK